MTAETGLLDALGETRILAIVRERDAATALAAARRLIALGLRVVEVSATTPDAVAVVAELVAESADRPDLVLGVGTVLDADLAVAAAAAGARFVIAPTFNPAVIAAAREHGLAAIPGCATPTEMHEAHRAGATAVKIFPAVAWRPAVLAAVLQALPDLRCVPTGGVGLEDVPAWLAAGALAVGLGSSLSRIDAVPTFAPLVAVSAGPGQQDERR